jgi:hypothetical protein
MSHDRPKQLLEIARRLAASDPEFQTVKGPSKGDHATLDFMRALRAEAIDAFGSDFSERKICGDTSFAVDFYFPEEATVVEVALGLQNPASEFEKDILKALMAQDLGVAVRRLYFIGRAGADKKCSQPGRGAVKRWALQAHDLSIEIHELGGEPRLRTRPSRARTAMSPPALSNTR